MEDRRLFWRFGYNEQRAVRQGDYKYLKINDNEFLFNIAEDPLERGNLKDRMPELFGELKQAYIDWNATMMTDPEAYSHGLTASQIADR